MNSVEENLTITFDETNINWIRDPAGNYLFLKASLNHMNNVLLVRGFLFVNDIFDQLRIPRTRFGQTHGWIYDQVSMPTLPFSIPMSEDLGPIPFVLSEIRDILDYLP